MFYQVSSRMTYLDFNLFLYLLSFTDGNKTNGGIGMRKTFCITTISSYMRLLSLAFFRSKYGIHIGMSL